MKRSAVFTVALIGPDGSGKSLVSSRLTGALPELPFQRMYMGINLEASRRMLPTTWLLMTLKRAAGGRPDMAGPSDAPSRPSRNPLKRLASGVKAWALLVNRVAEEWYRQLIVWNYQKRGYNVLFDRHFTIDYYFYDMQYEDPRKPLNRRVHGYLLRRYYPRPDLVIYLDAPAQVLYERKQEGTVETIERRRQEFLSLRESMPAFEIVDATQPVEAVVAQAAGIIRQFAAQQAGQKASRKWKQAESTRTR